jgi:hypothetical protein
MNGSTASSLLRVIVLAIAVLLAGFVVAGGSQPQTTDAETGEVAYYAKLRITPPCFRPGEQVEIPYPDLVAQLSPSGRRFLARDEWNEASYAARERLRYELVMSEACRHGLAERFPSIDFTPPMRILGAAAEQDWYRDSLTNADQHMVIAILQRYVLLADLVGRTQIGDPAEALVRALNYETHRHMPLRTSGWITILASSEEEALAREAFRILEIHLPVLDRVLGPLTMDTLTVLVGRIQANGVCGEASGASIYFLRLDCVGHYVTVHELTHLYLGGAYPTWYTEGVAYFWASFQTGLLRGNYVDRPLRDQISGELPLVLLEDRGSHDITQYVAGLLFLEAVYDVIGYEGMTSLSRNLRSTATGQHILNEIRVLTPPNKRATMEQVIARHVESDR